MKGLDGNMAFGCDLEMIDSLFLHPGLQISGKNVQRLCKAHDLFSFTTQETRWNLEDILGFQFMSSVFSNGN